MQPDQLRRAYHSLTRVDEIGSWSPDFERPVYLTLSAADPEGPVKDPDRLFLRLTAEEQDLVVHTLLAFHEGRLTELGVTWEEPSA